MNIAITGNSRLDDFRERIPHAVSSAVQVIADNPGQFAIVMAGSYVTTRMLARAVRPYGLFGVLCTVSVSYALNCKLAEIAIEKGWLKFRVRDENGVLMPMSPEDSGEACTD